MSVSIRREGDRVWLAGVSGWHVGEKSSSVHAAQEAVMRAVGEDTTYEYLLGVSGLAFRMQISKQGFCPSSPHSFCGYKCVARSVEALPWNLRIFEIDSRETEKVAEARRAVAESIERGVPAQYGDEEDGIIVGYQKGGKEWICFHPMRGGGKRTFIETEWPWGIAVLTSRKERLPSARSLAIGAMEQAVAMAGANETDKYFVGHAAWNEYIGKLKGLETADERVRQDATLGNAWIYGCLIQQRACASRYLYGVADRLDARPAGCVKEAAEAYENISSRILSDENHSGTAVAPYPWTLTDGKSWTAEMRQEQIGRLEASLPYERKAMLKIEEALALIKKEPSADESARLGD